MGISQRNKSSNYCLSIARFNIINAAIGKIINKKVNCVISESDEKYIKDELELIDNNLSEVLVNIRNSKLISYKVLFSLFKM